jgi:IclR family transcriptional regulator, KDG regulon repressor
MEVGSEKNRSDYYVRSVQRALHILSAFTSSRPYLGVSEIAEIVGIHKSTVHALLITLEDEGFVSKDEEKNKYFLTYKLFQLGCVVSENVSVLSIAKPYMKQLCKEIEQSVALNVLSNRKRLVLEVVENQEPMKLTIQPGQLLSLHSSAAGKVLMSGLSVEEFEEVVAVEGLKPMTPKTITDKDVLIKELALVRERGYALCSGESYWAGSVSAPLRGFNGGIVASLCIYGPMQDFEGKKLETYISACLTYSIKISQLLGYSPR